jgi:hypothetical protein
MAQSIRTLPANFPQPLGSQILRADTQRQLSILRQEVVTELLSLLADAQDARQRQRIIKLIETNLRAGNAAAEKAENLFPNLDEVKQKLESQEEVKPAVVKKHLKAFEQFARVQERSLTLLHESFDHIRLILERVKPIAEDAVDKAPQP